MRKSSIVIALLFGMTALAQSKPDTPTLGFSGTPATWVTEIAPMHQYATWSDKIAKDGHYVGTFDDPNNQFRCDVVSYLDIESRNVLYSDITSLTIVCTKKREPTHESQGEKP